MRAPQLQAGRKNAMEQIDREPGDGNPGQRGARGESTSRRTGMSTNRSPSHTLHKPQRKRAQSGACHCDKNRCGERSRTTASQAGSKRSVRPGHAPARPAARIASSGTDHSSRGRSAACQRKITAIPGAATRGCTTAAAASAASAATRPCRKRAGQCRDDQRLGERAGRREGFGHAKGSDATVVARDGGKQRQRPPAGHARGHAKHQRRSGRDKRELPHDGHQHRRRASTEEIDQRRVKAREDRVVVLRAVGKEKILVKRRRDQACAGLAPRRAWHRG